jgi:3-oxoacyl-[acyl-carrier-protein] synthase III
VPQYTVTAEDYYSRYGEQEVKRITLGTGIEAMHTAPKGIRASDLCQAAAEKLLDQLNIDRASIDGLVFVSQTPDYRMPATSALLQNRLGLKKSLVAFDINYGCSAYIYALYQAALLISSGGCERVLLCVGDTITQHLDPKDHKVNLVLGDAGSASLVEKGSDSLAFDIHTDGSGEDALKIAKDSNGQDQFLKMDGGAVMEFALREVKPVVERVTALQQWGSEDVQHVFLHQANAFMINYLRKLLGLAPSKVPVSVKQYGNTGPASIPLTLCDQFSKGDICHLGKSVLSGFGIGLSWGACALDLSQVIVLPVSMLPVSDVKDKGNIKKSYCA